jgi:hypothetical protein
MKALLLKLQSLIEDFEKSNSQIAGKQREADALKSDYERRLLLVVQREKDVNLREAKIHPIENLQAAIKENDKVTARLAEEKEKLRLDIADFKRKSDEERQYLKNRELAVIEGEKLNKVHYDELQKLKLTYKTQVLAELAGKK